MTFLVIKILLLLLLAALLGAWLMWWWLRRQYEDVTEERLATLEEAVRAIRVPEQAPAPDLAPLDRRLEALEEHVLPMRWEVLLGRIDELPGRVVTLAGAASSGAPTETPEADRVDSTDDLPTGVVREGSRNLLMNATFGRPDELQRIWGVGPKLETLLNDLGVFYFWQVADWTENDVSYVDGKLEVFKGRIERDGWVTQSRVLADQPGSAARPSAD